jgi:hypothetical protein
VVPALKNQKMDLEAQIEEYERQLLLKQDNSMLSLIPGNRDGLNASKLTD